MNYSTRTATGKHVVITIYALAIILLVLVTQNLVAKERNDNAVDFYVAGFRPDVKTQVRLDSEEFGLGSNITLEDDLAIESSKTLGSLTAIWHLSQRSSVEFGYFDLSRSGKRNIDVNIAFGDQRYDVNEEIETEFDATVYRLGYRYRFWHSEKVQFDALIGAHTTRFDINLKAVSSAAVEQVNETAPLPYAGLYGRVQLSENVNMATQIEYFDIKIKHLEGRLTNILWGLEYQFSQQTGVGVGYNYYDLEISSDDLKESFAGIFDFTFDGPLLFVRVGF